MDREMAAKQLAWIEQIVALGLKHIADQEDRIKRLRGHDLDRAEDLLKTFKQTQVLHEEHRDRLQREMGKPQAIDRLPKFAMGTRVVSEGVMAPVHLPLITNPLQTEWERAHIREERENARRRLEKTVAGSVVLLREADAAVERTSQLFHPK
jgi:hypothetical protein